MRITAPRLLIAERSKHMCEKTEQICEGQGHTPGPWRIVDREALEDGTVYPRHIVGGSRYLSVCLLESQVVADLAVKYPDSIYAGDSMVECEDDVRSKVANAHLIAAAPDLLQSLKEISDMFMARPDMVRALEPLRGFAENAVFDRAAASIAKAEGRA